MSLNLKEIAQLVGVARAIIVDVDNEAVIADESTFKLAFTDLDEVVATKLTRDQIAVLVNRFYAETAGVGTPTALAES